jgi:hypothetical protein
LIGIRTGGGRAEKQKGGRAERQKGNAVPLYEILFTTSHISVYLGNPREILFALIYLCAFCDIFFCEFCGG